MKELIVKAVDLVSSITRGKDLSDNQKEAIGRCCDKVHSGTTSSVEFVVNQGKALKEGVDRELQEVGQLMDKVINDEDSEEARQGASEKVPEEGKDSD
jgi:hypothetical protein